jgi:glycerol uptake facilitator-like aquaporin
METQFGRQNKLVVCLYEFFGTALLMLTVQLAKPMGIFHIPAICLAILAQIIIIGPVSGGHVNPAITFAVLIGYSTLPGQFIYNLFFSTMIMVSQTLGACFGCFIVFILLEKDDELRTIVPEINILCPP